MTSKTCPSCGVLWIPVAEELPPVVNDRGAMLSPRVLVRVQEEDGSVLATVDEYAPSLSQWIVNADRVTHWTPCLSPELEP